LDFEHTRLSLRRPLTSYAKVQGVISRFLRNRSWLINKSRLCGKEYLDVGCGPNAHDGFITLDYDWHPGIDIW
jgi:hypothetical protein